MKAPKDRWVIISVGGKKMNSGFDRWPLMDGEISSSGGLIESR